jgi:hypothetical protein
MLSCLIVLTCSVVLWVITLSVISPFIGLPGGRTLLVELVHADPLVLAISLVALLLFVVAPLGRWTALGRLEEPLITPIPAG